MKTYPFILLALCVFCTWAIFTPSSLQMKEFQRFEIQAGMPNKLIIQNLKKQQLIRIYFPYELFFRHLDFKTGEYSISSSKQSPYEIFQIFSKGLVITYDVTFPEGMNMFEIADLLAEKQLIGKEEFLKLCQNQELISSLLGEPLESLEGYLYPDTYKLIKGMSAKKLLHLMVGEFLKNYQSIQSSPPSNFSRHQLVTLASLVEKETGASWERPRIASVFYNRLKIGMKLQSDPTILYGILRETGFMPHNIRKQDIRNKTDYNTYTFKGFPKGPIANPGSHALTAVFKPEQTAYYYFVSKNDGTHIFSNDIQSHEKAVDLYQRKLKKP